MQKLLLATFSKTIAFDTSTTWTVEPRLTSTLVIWSPCCYGHFFPAGQNGHTFCYKKNPVNAVTH